MTGKTIQSTEASVSTKLRNKLVDHRGLIATYIGTYAFAIQAICVKLLKGDVPVIQLVCLRFFLQGMFSLMIGLPLGMRILPQSTRELLLLLARGTVGTVGMGLLYFAMFNMSVGLASAIVFGAPVFVGIFARIFLKEAFQCRDILLVVINVGGIFLIAQPDFLFKSESLDSSRRMELIAVAVATISMLMYALILILIRLLGLMNCGAIKIVFYYSICGTVLPAIGGLILQDWVVPQCGRARYLLVLIGFCNFVGQSLISYGLECTKKSYFVSVVNSNQVPVTIVLEIIVLAEFPNWMGLLGAALVIGSSMGVVYRERSLIGRRETEKQKLDERVKEENSDNTFILAGNE